MGQMFDNTCDQMNNCRCDNPCAFEDQVDHSNLQAPSSGKVKLTGERFSWYSSEDRKAKIEQPRCRQYKAGDFRAIRPLNWVMIIDVDDDDDNWADPRLPSAGLSRHSDGNDNDNGEGEEHMQASENGTGKEMGTNDGKG